MQSVIEAIIKGDTNAFNQLVNFYSARLMKLAFQYSQDWDDSADITQDTFIKAFRHLNSYDLSKPFEPWLYRIHINTCKNFVRRQSVKRLFLGKYTVPKMSDQIPNDIQPILDCVNRLSFKQRTAFILIELDGMSSTEAGVIMKCSPETARVHLHRAKTTLKNLLTNIGYRE